jgi:hypothetical protein
MKMAESQLFYSNVSDPDGGESTDIPARNGDGGMADR